MESLDKTTLYRVLELAERQLDQDERALSGSSITLAMMEDVTEDKKAIRKTREFFRQYLNESD